MRLLWNTRTASAMCAASLLSLVTPALRAQPTNPPVDASRRAALTVLTVDVPDWFAGAISRACGGDCRTRSSFERYDMLDVGATVRRAIGRSALFDSELQTWDAGATESLRAWVADNVARSAIAYSYSVGPENIWSVKRLQERAMYQTTLNDAMRDITTLRGVTGGVASDLIPHTYFAVMSVGAYRDSTYTEKPNLANGFQKRDMYSRTVPLVGALYQLAYEDGNAVRRALGEFYCGETADDCGSGATGSLEERRRARATAFASYTPPLQLVTTFVKPITMAVPRNASGTYDYSALAATALDTWPDFINGNVTALQTTSVIIGTGPIAARIGRKEGAERGKRFAVIRRIEEADGDVREKTVGIVRTVRAPDNRTTFVRRDAAGRQVLVAQDSATFKQFQGGSVERFDILRERSRYSGTLRIGLAGGASGPAFDLQMERPFDPINGWHYLLELGVHTTNSGTGRFTRFGGDSTLVGRLGVGLLNEIPIAKGNLRLIPQASAGVLALFSNASQPGGTRKLERAAYGWYARYGATMALSVSARVQLFGSALMSKTFDAIPAEGYEFTNSVTQSARWTDLTTSGHGLGYLFGLRWEH
jgi:hypothetical protein